MSRKHGLSNIARALQRSTLNPSLAAYQSPFVTLDGRPSALPPLEVPQPPRVPTAPWTNSVWQPHAGAASAYGMAGGRRASLRGAPLLAKYSTPSAVSAALFAARRTMFIQTQSTPNPNSLMFVPGQPVMETGSANFTSARESMVSPLAKRLFGVDGVKGVFFGSDFVTVTKDEEMSWATLKPEVFASMMDHFASGQPLINDAEAHQAEDTAIHEDDSEVVAMIKELLDTRIRPAVQEDGGDIKFDSFDEDLGYVYLKMQGACASCPSSSVTLKSGIENMLMHYIPEVKGVLQAETEEDNQLQNVAETTFSPKEDLLSN